jgi:Holliday junction resolvase RusA-like endonuclease
MALKKGNITQTTKSQKKKLEKLNNTEIKLKIEKTEDNKVKAQMVMNSVVEPYVRNRMSGTFKTNADGKKERTGGGHLYDPLNTYKNKIKKELTRLLSEQISDYKLCEGEIIFDIEIHTVPPKSTTKRQWVWAIIKKILRPLTKPDLDNVAKTAMDFCSGIFWLDDNQVVELRVRKFFGLEEKSIITFVMDIEPMKITGRADKGEEELWKTLQL